MQKLNALPEVVSFCKQHSLPADVVGRWVWLRFGEKPSEETRTLLKGAGFAWVKKRGQWAHACGGFKWKRSKAPYEPRDKYGSISVAVYAEDE